MDSGKEEIELDLASVVEDANKLTPQGLAREVRGTLDFIGSYEGKMEELPHAVLPKLLGHIKLLVDIIDIPLSSATNRVYLSSNKVEYRSNYRYHQPDKWKNELEGPAIGSLVSEIRKNVKLPHELEDELITATAEYLDQLTWREQQMKAASSKLQQLETQSQRLKQSLEGEVGIFAPNEMSQLLQLLTCHLLSYLAEISHDKQDRIRSISDQHPREDTTEIEKRYFLRLGEIFTKITGKEPDVIRNTQMPKDAIYSGNFFSFVNMCLKAINRGKANTTLGDKLQKFGFIGSPRNLDRSLR